MTLKCKICGRALELTVADEYLAAGRDPMNLISSATCNRCYDLRTERRKIERVVEAQCTELSQCSEKERPRRAMQVRSSMEVLFPRYQDVLCRQQGLKRRQMDSAVLDMLIDHPEHWNAIMRDYRHHLQSEPPTVRQGENIP